MKKLLLGILAVIGLLSAPSCKKINEATEFTMNYSTEVTVPASSVSVTAPVDFTSPEIPTQSSSRFEAEKTTKDLIETLMMSKCNLSTPKGNLDYIKSFSIFISANGVKEVLVASKSDIPAGSTMVAADLTGADLKEHIFKDGIKFRVSLIGKTGLTEDQILKIDAGVTVKGKKI
jgi:hypothetical protein